MHATIQNRTDRTKQKLSIHSQVDAGLNYFEDMCLKPWLRFGLKLRRRTTNQKGCDTASHQATSDQPPNPGYVSAATGELVRPQGETYDSMYCGQTLCAIPRPLSTARSPSFSLSSRGHVSSSATAHAVVLSLRKDPGGSSDIHLHCYRRGPISLGPFCMPSPAMRCSVT